MNRGILFIGGTMTNEELLKQLLRAEAALPALLKDDVWQSLYIDYEEPLVERLWRPWEDGRLYLHEIHPCDPNKALYHPHGWPSAMRIKGRSYLMKLGHGPGLNPPPVTEHLILSAGSAYTMADPDGWYSVCPLDGVVHSVMYTGKPWGRPAPKSVRALRSLTKQRVDELKATFQRYYPHP